MIYTINFIAQLSINRRYWSTAILFSFDFQEKKILPSTLSSTRLDPFMKQKVGTPTGSPPPLRKEALLEELTARSDISDS